MNDLRFQKLIRELEQSTMMVRKVKHRGKWVYKVKDAVDYGDEVIMSKNDIIREFG